MGLFSKKKACSFCGSNSKGKDLSDGFICEECVSKLGIFRPTNWKSISVEQAHDRIRANNEMQQRQALFSPTRSVEKFFEIDEKNRLWRWTATQYVFNYSDIVDFELIQNGSSVVKGGLGSAVMGGALFGGVGAVVGSVVGKKKAVEEINEFRIKIVINDMLIPEAYINFIPNGKLKSNSFLFKAASISAQETLSLLTLITSSKNSSENTVSAADEIRKFKELLDEGIISQEEFDRKKAQLLN